MYSTFVSGRGVVSGYLPALSSRWTSSGLQTEIEKRNSNWRKKEDMEPNQERRIEEERGGGRWKSKKGSRERHYKVEVKIEKRRASRKYYTKEQI